MTSRNYEFPTQLGSTIPANEPHAVSVNLPKWKDNVDYEEGAERVFSKMQLGYPRFFIHPTIQKLAKRLLEKFGSQDELNLLLPSGNAARRCRAFMQRYYGAEKKLTVNDIRIAEFEISPTSTTSEMQNVPIFIVLFPSDAFKFAKTFWQHTGDIISSRMAEYALRILDENAEIEMKAGSNGSPEQLHFAPKPKSRSHRHYSRKGPEVPATPDVETPDHEHLTYVEERYGRNLNLKFADKAKVALRRRIAGVMTESEQTMKVEDLEESLSVLDEQKKRQGERGVIGLSESDVFLFPCGMSAIFSAHRFAMGALDATRKSICYGFPYTDTLKILQKFGPGCIFYGLGEEKDIDDIQARLEGGERFLALFCECPSNPLLKTPNLRRLRTLADKYDILIIIDETIGNFSNIAVLDISDIVVSSLTKVFSGDSNVMGGSLVLNPNRKHYQELKDYMSTEYEDFLWCEDAIFLERNSRTFRERCHQINVNAEILCDFLKNHPQVDDVFYPKYVCKENYEAFKCPSGGYGGLFSVVLKSEKAAIAFYDALEIAKGPSLGTNFTLASPYAILAHYTELDWALEFGVARHLIRVSVGLEGGERLLNIFGTALDAIE
ncbi:hypothetical protein K450DRAFT_169273 [Umbelopsis ramanniana AG]|uniref:cystathionine gamma-synthase n=1 Tax=Umbelopsis ramanniana AG TaxID=1314678 RepID=A0AAD5HGJ0_UMBRA|nr:uncharacterized protein K450DRAFT_169273 [Umbelopsis ramanniana AG]KAI8583562.1 hypothetical protein K450DRAFT_169273 [Umbelopsis ramanniana AG]